MRYPWGQSGEITDRCVGCYDGTDVVYLLFSSPTCLALSLALSAQSCPEPQTCRLS